MIGSVCDRGCPERRRQGNGVLFSSTISSSSKSCVRAPDENEKDRARRIREEAKLALQRPWSAGPPQPLSELLNFSPSVGQAFGSGEGSLSAFCQYTEILTRRHVFEKLKRNGHEEFFNARVLQLS